MAAGRSRRERNALKRGIPERGDILQVRTLDYRERRAAWVETLPAEIVEEVLARVRTLLD